MNISAWRQHTT